MQSYYAQDLLDKTVGNPYKLMNEPYSLLLAKQESSVLPFVNNFAGYVKDFLLESEHTFCPQDDSCIFKSSKRKIYAVDYPKVFVINLIWQEFVPKHTDTLKIIASLPDKLNLHDIYGDVEPKEARHLLRGFICYGTGHYVAFLYNLADQK